MLAGHGGYGTFAKVSVAVQSAPFHAMEKGAKNWLGLSAGVRYMLIAGFCFSLMLLSVKFLTTADDPLPAIEIVFFRSIITLIFSVVLIRSKGIKPFFGNNRKMLFLRGFFGMCALSMFFMTVEKLPLAATVTVQYTSPIFTIIFAIFILKEKVSFWQWIFFAVSFIGVVMISGFEEEVDWLWVGVGLTSAIFSGVAYNMIRMVKDTDHPLVVVMYFPLVALPVTGIWSYFIWQTPEGIEWLWLCTAGVFTQIAQVYMTKSYHHATMAAVSSIRYLGIVYALCFGFFFFAETYSLGAYAGMAFVVGGVVLNVLFGKRKKPAAD